MKESITELEEGEGKVDIEVKIIYDRGKVLRFKDRDNPDKLIDVKSVIVADVLSEKGDPTAFLDLYGNDINKFKFGDVIKVTNAYTKKAVGGQMRLTYAQKIEKVK